MELKPYQRQVINDLNRYLTILKYKNNTKTAYSEFWRKHPKYPLTPKKGKKIEPYKNNVQRTPHVCVKVPTAGGKTFIGCNAIKTILNHYNSDKHKVIMWLVPSTTILEQTLNSFKNPEHPYRIKLDEFFDGNVAVLSKEELLSGVGFNPTTIKQQVTIMLFSFDSLRSRKKEFRKVFQENGNLQSFSTLLQNNKDITLGEIIKVLEPTVIVDESHNAQSELSIKMLEELNPSFILELTATPRDNSNIISFVDALELKKENMVKLPVIVKNQPDTNEVINSAIQLQRQLEVRALEEERTTGTYIRPIVLFQAQTNNDRDATTFVKLKEKLIQLQIPEEQIKIKTAEINEIKDINLLSRTCKVRYIITINALKEGWDCPFAYILASLANKNSEIDVTQILGRILRQPYIKQHNQLMLNSSYVLTASESFQDTLANIIASLNHAGYSRKDYRVKTEIKSTVKQEHPKQLTLDMFAVANENPTINFNDNKSIEAKNTNISGNELIENINTEKIINTINQHDSVNDIEKIAIEQNNIYNRVIESSDFSDKYNKEPSELKSQILNSKVNQSYVSLISQIRLPEFYMLIKGNEIFDTHNNNVLFNNEALMANFNLLECDNDINFDDIDNNIFQIDLNEKDIEHTPDFTKLTDAEKSGVLNYLMLPENKNERILKFANRMVEHLDDNYPISYQDLKEYVINLLSEFTDDRFNHFVEHQLSYNDKIKKKIKNLMIDYSIEEFKKQLDKNIIFARNSYILPETINPHSVNNKIKKSLYEYELELNKFEKLVIRNIINLSNVVFWTRNIENQGFKINGFIDYYPEFIIYTKKENIIIIDTRSDKVDALYKIKQGNLWAKRAGNKYFYFMIKDKKSTSGAYALDDVMELIANC